LALPLLLPLLVRRRVIWHCICVDDVPRTKLTTLALPLLVILLLVPPLPMPPLVLLLRPSLLL
jgi:hypothetical protein